MEIVEIVKLERPISCHAAKKSISGQLDINILRILKTCQSPSALNSVRTIVRCLSCMIILCEYESLITFTNRCEDEYD